MSQHFDLLALNELVGVVQLKSRGVSPVGDLVVAPNVFASFVTADTHVQALLWCMADYATLLKLLCSLVIGQSDGQCS